MAFFGFVTLFCVFVIAHGAQGSSNQHEAKVRLQNTLLRGYNKAVRPISHDGNNVTITVGVSLYLIKHLDDKNQIFSTSLWIRQKWFDPRLTWHPPDFHNITYVNLRAKQFWLPDIKVYNEIERLPDNGLDQFHTRIVLDHKGNLLWMGPFILKSSCQVNIKMFPYDTQRCEFKVGSWTYDSGSVDVHPESYTMDISKSPSNPEWQLLNTSVVRNVIKYPCCPESYPDITYTITIKRRVQSYWMNFLYPGLFLTVLTMLGFITPPSDTGERISLVLTSLVSMFFFLKMISDKTPSSETIPLLSVFFVVLSFEIGLIFYSVCVSVNVYHRRCIKDMPKSVRGLVLQKLCGLWGLSERREAIARRIRELEQRCPQTSLHASMSDVDTVDEDGGPHSDNLSNNQPPPASHCGNEFIWLVDRECSNAQKRGAPSNFRASELCIGHQTRNASSTMSEDSSSKPSSNVGFDISNSNNRSSDNIPNKPNVIAVATGQSSLQSVVKAAPNSAIGHKGSPCSCSALLHHMVAANDHLISNLHEVCRVAQESDKQSSEKELWFLASSILDQVFLAFFLLCFIVMSLINFFPILS